MSISSQDKELLKRLALAEARGEGVVGQALVIRSVLNRREAIRNGANFNTTSTDIYDIVYAKNQYQPTRDSRNSIDQPFSNQQLLIAEEAYRLALNPSELQSKIQDDGYGSIIARNLVLSTGFDSLGGQGRPDAITYKNHVFVENINNFGVTGDSIYKSSIDVSITKTSEVKDPVTEITTNEEEPIVVPDEPIFIENIYSSLREDVILDRINELNIEIEELNKKSSDLWDDEERKRYIQIKSELDRLYEAKLIKENTECNSRQTAKGFNLDNTPDCEKFAKSVALGEAVQTYNKERTLPNPCGTSEISKINTALKKFFIIIKGIKKYTDLYVNGSINKLQNIVSLIRQTSKIIGAVLKTLVTRLRDFLIDKIRTGIQDLLDKILPTITKSIKNSIIQIIVDNLFCSLKNIVKSIPNLITDFLFELVGKVINVPFCVAEQFTNALINNLAATIDKTIGPILNNINDLLKGFSGIVGSVFEALDFILGFESFLCAKPNCPEIKAFKASPWAGPSQAQIDAFNKFLPAPKSDQVVEGAVGWIDGFEIFGEKLGDSPSSTLKCDSNLFECGPPRVEIFGGGGIGATGEVVVDNIGRVIGVSLSNGGNNYSRPPFVSFIDSCEDTFTSGYCEIDDDGHVINIVMTSTPVVPSRDGRTEFELLSNIPQNSLPAEKDYVVCLKGFRIKSTGIGYTINDNIKISPDIPNLEASVKMTEYGQIIGIDVLTNVCGIQEYPEISVESLTGNGAIIEPELEFLPIQDFDPTQPDELTETPTTAGGTPVIAGGTGGTPVTVGGIGGTPVTAGGTPVTVGGIGGTPVTAGGTPVTAGGIPVTAGGTGGIPVTAGGTGGTPVTAGGTGGTPVTAGGTGGTPVTVGGIGGTPATADTTDSLIVDFNLDSITLAQIVDNDVPGLIKTLRGKKIITEKQDFTRKDVIRIVDCIN